MENSISLSSALLFCNHDGCTMEYIRTLNNYGLYRITPCSSIISAIEIIKQKNQRFCFFIYDDFHPKHETYRDILNISQHVDKIILFSDISEPQHEEIIIWAWRNNISKLSTLKKPLAPNRVFESLSMHSKEGLVEHFPLIQKHLF